MRQAVYDRLLNLATSRQGTQHSSDAGCSLLPVGLRQAWLWAGLEGSGRLPYDSGRPLPRRAVLHHWQSSPYVCSPGLGFKSGNFPEKSPVPQRGASSKHGQRAASCVHGKHRQSFDSKRSITWPCPPAYTHRALSACSHVLLCFCGILIPPVLPFLCRGPCFGLRSC